MKTYIDVTCLSDDTFAVTIVVASLCLVVKVAQKEEREKDRQRKTKEKNL
jgi:hypothetical protein